MLKLALVEEVAVGRDVVLALKEMLQIGADKLRVVLEGPRRARFEADLPDGRRAAPNVEATRAFDGFVRAS